MKPTFSNEFTALEKEVIHRLAEIEQEDADACAGCGGEDCICCEIYHDRQKWVSPKELFQDLNYDPDYDYYDEDDERHYERIHSVRIEDLTGESKFGGVRL
jgi:hypothetical protein